MDNATQLIDSVARLASGIQWPLTVAIALVLLRKHIGNMVPRVKRLRVGDNEVEFAEEVAKLADSAAALDSAEVLETPASIAETGGEGGPAITVEPSTAKPLNREEIWASRLYEQSAWNLIVIARQIDALILEAERLASSAGARTRNPLKALHWLNERNLLSEELMGSIQLFRRVRSMAIHQGDLPDTELDLALRSGMIIIQELRDVVRDLQETDSREVSGST